MKELRLINIGPLGAKIDYSVATNLEILEVRDFNETKFEEYYEMSQMELVWFSFLCLVCKCENILKIFLSYEYGLLTNGEEISIVEGTVSTSFMNFAQQDLSVIFHVLLLFCSSF